MAGRMQLPDCEVLGCRRVKSQERVVVRPVAVQECSVVEEGRSPYKQVGCTEAAVRSTATQVCDDLQVQVSVGSQV